MVPNLWTDTHFLEEAQVLPLLLQLELILLPNYQLIHVNGYLKEKIIRT